VWTVTIGNKHATAPRLYLCTGSHPTPADFADHHNPSIHRLDLDQVLVKSSLPSLLPDSDITIAVIGSSHSGILVCRNLYEVAHDRQIAGLGRLKIKNFQRSGIRYAEYREDGIVYDNTGLKGATADWARKVMEPNMHRDTIEQIKLGDDEDDVYSQHLGACTHIVYATGYTANALPPTTIRGERIEGDMRFDHATAEFKLGGKVVQGLHGCGIAFPEETTDPEGHREMAVGVAKFFKFAERIKGDWVEVEAV
jgi:hypothetical protein